MKDFSEKEALNETTVRPKYASRRNKEKFQQITEFERVKIVGLQEGGFSYHVIGARVQWSSSTVMRVWKQWTDEHRATRKTGSARRKVTSARDDRHLLHVAVNDRTACSRQLAEYESRFTLYDPDGRIRVRRYAGEYCLPQCVIERHSGLTSGVMAWVQFRIMYDPICYELRLISIATGTSMKCYSRKSFYPFKESYLSAG
ncbi:uncharacterized protein TNCV_3957231 [Trichonephila clavipes]|nr:uncharacterized protein TNCV_3957231 [Trichonephila clavipes]